MLYSNTTQCNMELLIYDIQHSKFTIDEIEKKAYVCKGTISQARRKGCINKYTLKTIAELIGKPCWQYANSPYSNTSDAELRWMLKEIYLELERRKERKK